ncbi:MAG: hypothetical protein CMG71_01115 [Candidatus Marinimicrobia bacterium]|nr:hypothetical protein [Candidatus Neomarinimicrobiota bacterium]|tara:strand:+ start:93058 stop:94017 length:960 start_codon:yes stop_codon:yes gene_type:complete
MEKILICGATGFIGRNLTENFSSLNRFDVHAVWHKRPPSMIKNVTWHQCDLRNPKDVNRLVADMDIIVQAAATTSGSKDIVNRPYIHVTDNAVMNSLILKAAFDNEVKHFVFFSCTVMYSSSMEPVSEKGFDGSKALHPSYFGVGWTKVYIEKMCEFYSKMGRTRHTVIRHSNVYGPHDKFDLDHSHVFGATINKVMSANKKISVWGEGKEKRDLLYVDDLVSFVKCALAKQKTPYELFNCGLGKAVSIRELVDMIVLVSGKVLDVEHDLSKPSIKTSLFLECSKAKEILGWESQIGLEMGIEKTIEWYRSNFVSNALE